MTDRFAPNSSGPASRRALALRFISGKYQGGEFPLENGQEIVVGRSSDLDMVLVEEMVSRRHARIQVRDGMITIQDLGSTNGTFVNGEKIRHAQLREGDRVLIGTSILKVVAIGPRPSENRVPSREPPPARRDPGKHRASGAGEAPRMSGNIQEIPLPDLLQLFGTSRKTGVLVIRGEHQTGKVYLDQGYLQYALIEGHAEVHPLKAIYRMLGWPEGMFELEPPESRTFEHPLDATVQEVLMEGFRQLDEFNQVKKKLPPLESRMILRTPLEAPLHELEPSHLDILQQALNSPSLQALLDRTTTSDLEVGQIILALMDRGYLTPSS